MSGVRAALLLVALGGAGASVGRRRAGVACIARRAGGSRVTGTDRGPAGARRSVGARGDVRQRRRSARAAPGGGRRAGAGARAPVVARRRRAHDQLSLGRDVDRGRGSPLCRRSPTRRATARSWSASWRPRGHTPIAWPPVTDPYRDRGLTGMVVKAYRDDFDRTLQPYARVPAARRGAGGRVAAAGLAARRVLEPPAEHAPGVRQVEPPRRIRRGGDAQRAAAARRADDRRLAIRARRVHGISGSGRARRLARDGRRAPRLCGRSRSRLPDRAVDGRRGDLAHRPAPPRSLRGDRPGLRHHRRAPVDRRARTRRCSIRRCWA